jgi:hypothetical protein
MKNSAPALGWNRKDKFSMAQALSSSRSSQIPQWCAVEFLLWPAMQLLTESPECNGSLPATVARACASTAPKWPASAAAPMPIGSTGASRCPRSAIRAGARTCAGTGARRARLQPHRAPLHRRRLGRFPFSRAPRGRLCLAAQRRLPRRRHEAHRPVDQRRSPLRSAGQQAHAGGAAQLRTVARSRR